MSEIYLPQKIFFGKGSLDSSFAEKSHRILIITEDDNPTVQRAINLIEQRYKKMITQQENIVNQKLDELCVTACRIIKEKNFDLLVAIGSGSIIDCGMLIASKTGIMLAAVPFCAPTAFTDFSTAQYRKYFRLPDIVILDSSLILEMNSSTIAYESLSCLAYAVSSELDCDNFLKSYYNETISSIVRNIIPSFRGNINSLEKLMYSMFRSMICFANQKSNNFLTDDICTFFSKFGHSKQSLAALCAADITEELCKDNYNLLAEIPTNSYKTSSMNYQRQSMMFVDEIRHIQAATGIPRSVKAFGIPEDDFLDALKKNSEYSDLKKQCYYGSFIFAKL